MNHRIFLLTTLLAALATAGRAQQMEFLPDAAPAAPSAESVKYTLLKPADKTSETVKEGEHNPFGKSETEMRSQNQKGTNEENQIREKLERLRVVGVSPGSRGLRVMLGDMVLEPGLEVPQVLPDQSLTLRVGRISSEAIELIWVEKKPTGLPTRSMIISVDLRPYVRYKLGGQATDKNQWEKQPEGSGQTPVARMFPEVAQTEASGSLQHMAQNTQTIPTAVAVDSAPPAKKAEDASAQESVKANTQWEKAMSLLDKILSKEAPKP